VAHRVFGAPRHAGVARGEDGQRGSLLGPTFDDAAVAAALEAAGLRFHAVPDAAERNDIVADALAGGMVVGHFAGPMEFGPRALGNRSILADPRREDGQAHINVRIKFREGWRPFAPAVLAEHAASLFGMEGDESPYMLLTAPVREHLRCGPSPAEARAALRTGNGDMLALVRRPRSALPAVTHVDGSARVQTVDPARNPGFHALLARFHALTGCPALVNTSFNVRGEPIVCTPEDAVRCFLNTGLDLLAIGGFLVWRREQAPEAQGLQGSMAFAPD